MPRSLQLQTVLTASNLRPKDFHKVLKWVIILGQHLHDRFRLKERFTMSGQTLFEKYGGFSKVSKIVLAFYDTLLDSDEIGPFFDDVDMGKMVDHQTKFIASLLGGPASYTDKQLSQLHAHLEISDAHFDELKVVLRDTLNDHSVETADVEIVLREFETRRQVIVG